MHNRHRAHNLQMLAQFSFEAYNRVGPNPGLAHDGKPVPGWDEIAPEKREQIQTKWKAAASEAAQFAIQEVSHRIADGFTPAEALVTVAMLFRAGAD